MAWHGTLDSIAKRLRSQQSAIIADQNNSSREKSLRSFSSKEASSLLGITESHLRNRVSNADGFPQGTLLGKSRTFTLDEIIAARRWLYESTGNQKYKPSRRNGEALCVIANTNFKGGVGKSTSTVHLAQYLALKGYRILIVDLDAQASSTALFGIDPARHVGRDPNGRVLPAGTSIHGWISRSSDNEEVAAEEAVRSTYWPNIDLVAASAILHSSEDILKQRSMPNMHAPISEVDWHREVRAFLDHVGGQYDVAILDCRPDINMLSVNAFSAADGLIVPVLATNMDLQSMTEFMAFLAVTERRLLKMYGQEGWPGWAFVRVLVNRFVGTSRPQTEVVDSMNLVLGPLMIRNPMVETSALGSAGNMKWTLYEYLPAKSEDRSYKRAVAAMDAVGAVIEREILSFWGRKLQDEVNAAHGVAAE
ncbi:AAA family ATPase [Roseomonas xinghualingensis]|uniref:AAA family ATPase n=1 Tax=Roseomonas xinghualingensis TaxID=2986475 RepID=UPI0021F1B23E|nr:AAA family ATPase [Roseomonas sp. SXEYE001]MCV4210177.1 AAA family ATPase [Roseomonas sp. SXEYE001]